MKNIISLFLIMTLLVTATSAQETEIEQDAIDSIRLGFTNYLLSIENKDFETSVNYVYPDFLEIVTKERMIELFSSVFHNPATDLKLKDSKILSISEIEEIDGKFYSKIQFSRIIVVKESSRNDEDHEVTLAKYAEVFGKEDVSYDEEIDRFLILSEVNAVAISNDGTTLWSFISISKSQRDFLKDFLPKEILDNI